MYTTKKDKGNPLPDLYNFLVLFYPYLFRNQTKNQQVVFVYNRVFLVIVLAFRKIP